MADDAKLMKHIAFRERLQRDIKLIFHKDKRLELKLLIETVPTIEN